MEKIETNDIRKIKDCWYNMILKEPLRGGENTNIQYIIKYEGTYGVASMKPLTIEDIENINLNDWNFKPFSEVMKGSKRNEK